ncbi:MAG: cysteine desulfurase [Crocinitomicaceae bacterium]|nr:cysteine desulfurase [Crocinitomicaceae bacterium]MDG1776547.1 cysteine desulfurase [Crocinitomicaceae bacterium]
MMVKEDIQLFDIDRIRDEFPTLSREVYGKPLIYLDNGATSQKPQVVIDSIEHYYTFDNSNIHRGVHHMSQEATTQYENARVTIQKYINSPTPEQVLFTTGTTGGINLIAHSFGELLSAGDEIIISTMEHHSNIVPWQMLCERKGCKLNVIPINDHGELIMSEFEKLLNNKTKLVSVTHISNTLGTINPIKHIIDSAHKVGAKVLIDGAQSIQHMSVDVQALDCDFFLFSGHKVFGPTGVGILYGKTAVLNSMPPYQGGGDMIDRVTFEKTTYNVLPHKFEAGTPNISGGIALGVAINYLANQDLNAIQKHEHELGVYATTELNKIEGMRIIGTSKEKTSVISFVVEGLHPFDIGTLLDKQGVAVRTGHHCTQPLMDFFNIPGTVRASFTFYNTKAEVDIFIKALNRSINMLR